MPTITKELLLRYFQGQCNPEETEAVRDFITSETDPALVEASMQEVFELQKNEQLISLSEQDYAHAWQQFQQKSGRQPAPAKRLAPMRWLRYAAAAVLIVAISIASWQLNSRKKMLQPATGLSAASVQRIQAPKGARKQITLTDGSTVYLFPGSQLSIPGHFNEKDRLLQLKGRAFFEITQNPQKPFRVQTGQLTTSVLGTSFEINGALGAQIAITVLTGMVGTHDSKNELTRLTSNQQLIYKAAGGTYTVHPADAAGLCNWINGELVFDNTPLPEVCQALEQWYGATIQLDKERWQAKKISVKFKDQPLSTVLQVLSQTSGFRYKYGLKEAKIY